MLCCILLLIALVLLILAALNKGGGKYNLTALALALVVLCWFIERCLPVLTGGAAPPH